MDVAERIAHVVQELQTIQTEMERPPTVAGIARPSAPEALLWELKAAVDRMRLFLWAQMDSRAASSQSAKEAMMQRLRIERAVEMLHNVRVQMDQAGLPDERAAQNLMTEIHALSQTLASSGKRTA